MQRQLSHIKTEKKSKHVFNHYGGGEKKKIRPTAI